MTRLDVYLVENGYFDSRERAKTEILAGNVLVNEQRLKASDKVKDGAVIRIVDQMPFVSRGGYKLDKAVKAFRLDLHELVCLDIGASTGGFTDVMLQNGAAHVYAVDVGYGQLHYKLRQDKRVTVMERCNARNLTAASFPEKMDFASMDVAFISILHILPALCTVIKPEAKIVALIKPQFEASRDKVGKHGVVKDEKVHRQVIAHILEQAEKLGLVCEQLDFSPIKGPEGNIEFLALFSQTGESGTFDLDRVVQSAHHDIH